MPWGNTTSLIISWFCIWQTVQKFTIKIWLKISCYSCHIWRYFSEVHLIFCCFLYAQTNFSCCCCLRGGGGTSQTYFFVPFFLLFWNTLGHLVHFGQHWSIWAILEHIGPFWNEHTGLFLAILPFEPSSSSTTDKFIAPLIFDKLIAKAICAHFRAVSVNLRQWCRWFLQADRKASMEQRLQTLKVLLGHSAESEWSRQCLPFAHRADANNSGFLSRSRAFWGICIEHILS